MTVFERTVTSRLSAFQFKMIELSEREADSSPSVKAHYQADKQWAAFKAAEMPVNLGDLGFAHFHEDEPLTLAVTVSVPGYFGSVVHLMKLGDWLVVEPLKGSPRGEVLTDEQFRELGAVAV